MIGVSQTELILRGSVCFFALMLDRYAEIDYNALGASVNALPGIENDRGTPAESVLRLL